MKKLLEWLDKFAEKCIKPIDEKAERLRKLEEAERKQLEEILRRNGYDNMRSAPDQMKNANGNVLFNMFATDLGLYAEKYSALGGDLKTANDFMNLYGFSFDSIANVKDYVHIRKYHNYVKAQLQGITGNISNTARDDLRQRFASGIRFWNQDEISYQYENYELWLED